MKKATNKGTSNPSRAETDNETYKAELKEGGKVLAETTDTDVGCNPYVSMYSITLTTLQLVEIYDDQPGRQRRIEILNALAKEFNQFT